MLNVGCLARMPDDAIKPAGGRPLDVRVAGIWCRMTGAGWLKHLDPVPVTGMYSARRSASTPAARRAAATSTTPAT
jgi:hypothetical protein